MYVVTDLTRFAAGNPNVCTALISIETGVCVRPMPYFSYELMRRHNVLPGALFSGTFTFNAHRVAPHTEDCAYSGLTFHGPATASCFQTTLNNSAHSSISQGFGCEIQSSQKVISLGADIAKSLATVRLDPRSLNICSDSYTAGKIKANIVDSDGQEFRFLPITDLGFFDYARRCHGVDDVRLLNEHIQSSDELYLRVGLSRSYTSRDGRCGYWIQINGIYTFPSKLDLVRGYT